MKSKFLGMAVCTLVLLFAAPVASAGTITEYDGAAGEATWVGLVSPLFTEGFEDATLLPGLTITPDNAMGFSIGGGELFDVLLDTTTYAFEAPIRAFGVNIDTDSPAANFSGSGISVTVNFVGGGSIATAVPSSDGFRFWGFTADMDVESVVFSTSPLETYRIDDLRIDAIPEPTSLALLGLGIAGFVARRRRRA